MTDYHVIIYCPDTAADTVRRAAANAGAGAIGAYDSCSFTTTGTGRFRGTDGSQPAIGTPGILEEVAEQRIECTVSKECIADVLQAIIAEHPYEEPAMHVLPMLNYRDLL